MNLIRVILPLVSFRLADSMVRADAADLPDTTKTNGIVLTDCNTCSKLKNHKFCIPYENFVGQSKPGYSHCCNMDDPGVDANVKSYPCHRLPKSHLCTDFIKYNDEGFAADQFLYNSFCAYDSRSCYMTKSVDEDRNIDV